MEFFAEHLFVGIDVPAFEQLYFDEPFNEALCAHVHIERHLIARRWQQGHLARQVRVHPQRAVPAPVRKLLGQNGLGYIERMEYSVESHEGQFTCTPTVLADRVQVQGHFSLHPHGEGVLQRVRGQVHVRIFGLGKMVERLIVDDTEKSYADAAQFTRAHLQKTHVASGASP